MSAKPKKSARMGKRYTDAEKAEVINYVNEFNASNGRGGQAAAVKKFGVTALTITAWSRAAGTPKGANTTAPKPAKKVAAPKAAKKVAAPKAAKKAAKKATKKAAKKVAAPKPAKKVAAPKPAKKAAAPKAAKPVAVKATRKAGKKAPQGTRYTDDQKQAVLAYVTAVNAKKGRGGMSAAAKKFKITPLTVSTWIRKFGTGGSAPAPAAPKDNAKLLARLAKAEAIIASIKTQLGAK
ncbi:MAG: hypothetical protein K9M97_12930 [Akkermansiaceae bacterium]|nr:hypothetical protein [Akkermansiaceae bacterium]